jgi:hypothetical protein
VIRHGVEVQGLPQLDLEARGMPYGFALGIAIGVVRGGEGAKGKGVEGVGGVNVQVAEEGGPIGVGRRRTQAERVVRGLEDGAAAGPANLVFGVRFAARRLLGSLRAAHPDQKQ